MYSIIQINYVNDNISILCSDIATMDNAKKILHKSVMHLYNELRHVRDDIILSYRPGSKSGAITTMDNVLYIIKIGKLKK